jgi:hypothetical protein
MAKKNNSHAPDGHQLLTPKDVARELAVSEAWVRDHTSGRRKPYLPHVRLGDRRNQVRVRRNQLDKFLEDYTRNAPSDAQ